MDNSLEVTVTWCCTATTREAERSISSTPGECNRFSMAGFTCKRGDRGKVLLLGLDWTPFYLELNLPESRRCSSAVAVV